MDVIPTNLNWSQPKTHMHTRVYSNNIIVCVLCVDIEATLAVLLEALTQLTQHISLLYTLVQALMDNAS